MTIDQVLTAEQMRAAEQQLFDRDMSVTDLMEIAAGGAAQWVLRIAAGRSVTVLSGPGNNGGDGYVIARRLREAGLRVTVVAPILPKTPAAATARNAWKGPVLTSGGNVRGEVLVDCLFGSGLARPLSGEHALLLRDLAKSHAIRIAIDVPSGIASDTGEALTERLPYFDVTLALGAWKFAHCLAAPRARLGTQRLVRIGVGRIDGSAHRIGRPKIAPPAFDAHKYTRGLCAVVGGPMPGAAVLSAMAAMRAGAGYVKLLAQGDAPSIPPGLVRYGAALETALGDHRIDAVLIGPGLGRDDTARERLQEVLGAANSAVLDADVLHLLTPDQLAREVPLIATPHDGELDALCRAFSVIAEGRMDKALALARTSGMVVLAKGPDTFIAAPDGRLGIAPPSSSWLSVAGSGDVLAGIVTSRLAHGGDAFAAACEGVWLHSEAARLCGAAFTPDDLAGAVSGAVARCL